MITINLLSVKCRREGTNERGEHADLYFSLWFYWYDVCAIARADTTCARTDITTHDAYKTHYECITTHQKCNFSEIIEFARSCYERHS